MIFSLKSTETIPLKKPENPETNPETRHVNEKSFRNSGVLYILEKVNKSRLHWYHFLKR